MKKLELGCYGISINYSELNKSSASLFSEMKNPYSEKSSLFNSAVDGLESIILAHFCAGVDISSPAYIEGIKQSYQDIVNNLDDNDEDSQKNISHSFSLKSNNENVSVDKDIKGYVEQNLGHAIALHFDGYGDHCSLDDNGTPVYIERNNNDLVLVVYADINQEDPTHIISLDGAKNTKRDLI